MRNFLDWAREMSNLTLEDRRHLHRQAEAGLHLPETTAYLVRRLVESGMRPAEICDSGISCLIGGKKPGKTFLLRADMDALPMKEESGLPFSSSTSAAHNCGHDFHMAMLLTAAAMLKEVEDEINGTVKLMFQPGEEVMRGADLMIQAGILENPKVDAALALHVMPDAPPGTLSYNRGALFASSDNFVINIKGKGSHGAAPHLGVDPINVGAHIYLAFQELIARESPFLEPAVLTIGEFKAGSAFNILPEECLLRGSLRTYSTPLRDFLVRRMAECAGDIARAYRAELRFEIATSLPSTINNPELTDELLEHIDDLGFNFGKDPKYLVAASEDFSLIGRLVPSCMLLLGAGQKDNPYFLHNPKLAMDEAALPLGAAVLAQCAFGWLTR